MVRWNYLADQSLAKSHREENPPGGPGSQVSVKSDRNHWVKLKGKSVDNPRGDVEGLEDFLRSSAASRGQGGMLWQR